MYDEHTTLTTDEYHRLLRQARQAEAMRMTLRTIWVWAKADTDETMLRHQVALVPEHVMAICDKALKEVDG
jgi:hypothetical protein